MATLDGSPKMLTTLSLCGAFLIPTTQDPERTSSRPSRANNDMARIVEQDFGANPPGRDVMRGRAFLPMHDAPYGSAKDVSDRVREEDLVIGLVVEGQAFAYPINMLGGPQREIVNEEYGGVAFCVNW
jgi:hypothetical protein